MEGFSIVSSLGMLWAVVTATLVGSVIYRAIVGIHEEDQLFLDSAEAALESERALTLQRIRHIDGFVKLFGIASGALLLVLAAFWVYEGLFTPPTL